MARRRNKPLTLAQARKALVDIRDAKREWVSKWYALHGFANDLETEGDMVERMRRIAREAVGDAPGDADV